MKTTRKELFDKAWELPMTKLAKEFGCSDVGLRKACVKNQIPLPPQGHWQKLSYGKGFTKPKLPRPDFNPDISIDPQAVKIAKEAHQETVEVEAAVKTITNPRITIAKNLNNPHTLISQALKTAEDYKRCLTIARKVGWGSYYKLNSKDHPPHDDNGKLRYSEWDGCIPMSVSFATLDRALRILDPLLKALELGGFKIHIPKTGQYERKNLLFEKDGEKLEIFVREGYTRVPISTKLRTIADKFDLRCNEKENFANGLLNIEVKIQGHYRSVTFKDLKKVSLEEQMDLLLQYMLDAPQQIKDRRAEQKLEEDGRRDRQAIRNFNENIIKSQQKQYEHALEEVRLHKQHLELKEYIRLLEAQMFGFSKKEKGIADHWIRIVQTYAQEADPIKKRLEHIRKIANEPVDKYSNYWCKKSRPYTPQDEDEWDDECEDY